MLVYLWREFGRGFRVDAALWRNQLAYALPFALAVGIEVVQVNYHQWVVASRFDAATFAIYAVGCLQIPLIDLVCTSTVQRDDGQDGRGRERRTTAPRWRCGTTRPPGSRR